jgi:AraC-like DNA-binding protein
MIADDFNSSPYESEIRVILWENRENEQYPLHWHTASEIIMPLENDYEVVLRGAYYRLKENDIFIIPSRELHKAGVPDDVKNGTRVILLFEPVLLYSLAGLSGAVSRMHNLNLITPEKTPEIHRAARSLLMDAYHENKKPDRLKHAAISAKIIELYVCLARYYIEKKNLFPDFTPAGRQDCLTRLNMVFNYIDRHISEELTLESAAKIANFSKFHFSHVFKKYTGMSFHQHLQSKRIAHAELLLLNPETPVIDIALNSGFSTLSTFNHAFKKIKNCTPSEYRKLRAFGI